MSSGPQIFAAPRSSIGYNVQSLDDRYVYFPSCCFDPAKAKISMKGDVIKIKPHKQPRREPNGVQTKLGGNIIVGKQADLTREPLIELKGPKSRGILQITVWKNVAPA